MQYFSREGKTIHKVGVEPDHVITLEEGDYVDGKLPEENDRQLQKALELLR